MLAHLDESTSVGFFFQEGSFLLKGGNNNLFCSFDGVLSIIVLLLFLSPFLFLKGLLLVEFNNLLFDQSLEVILFSQESDFTVSNGDLLFELSL